MSGMQYSGWQSPRYRNRTGISQGDIQERALLEATRRLLQQKLPSQLTVGSIASEAGLARSTVYFYFDSKESILSATIESVVGPMMDEHEQLLTDNGFTAAFPAILRLLFATWKAHSGILSGVMEFVASNPDYRRVWRGYMERSVALQVAALERDRQRGLPVGGGDLEAELLAFCWMAERCCYMLFSRDHEGEEETHLFELLFGMASRITGTRLSDSSSNVRPGENG
ncbi:TetR/AcrR family transcriptional regulator [Actinopolyspora mortivallis]|uniref:TetR/AcrR family transcriptional regulator n=1 Tax=Actinopolyspora mortivallis TaxID=33906 RepID=UPI00036849F1|nr:TetR/AcrR family transcriptional regulator [Actinopolyspora mortivallis]